MPWKHALRDLAVLAVVAGIWTWDTALRGGDAAGPLATSVGLAAGLLAALAGYLLHEWGHLTGALAARSRVHLPKSVASVFLFRFDVDTSTRAQFLAMSCGGFAASAVVVAVYLTLLPRSALSGKVALAATALGVLATAVLELPVTWRVLRGGALPRGAAYVSSRNPSQTEVMT